MADAAPLDGPVAGLTTADGRPLREALVRSQKLARRRAFLLVLPLLLFILVSFILPIGQMLTRSVTNDQFAANAPALRAWFDANPDAAPDEAAFAALRTDLEAAVPAKTIGSMGARINYDVPGTRSLFTSTGRKISAMEPPYREAFLAISPDWGRSDVWAAMRAASHTVTANFYRAAVDRKLTAEGEYAAAPKNERIYVTLFLRTFALSATITVLCLLLGFPIAHLLATLSLKWSNLLMILVLLPFWTALLVRTTAWIALLQQQGVINSLLVWLGLIGEDGRLAMINNQTGTLIAMTHILLPFMILPLYSVMKTIPPSYARASRSLGASSWTTFRRVYLPQTVPGIGAGAILVFILAVGYYITPALVGGATGTLISNQIAFHMEDSFNWSLAAALAAMLLGSVLVLYWVYDRIVGIDNMKLG